MNKQEVAVAGGKGKRLVVIGGGIAGSVIAKSLQFSADVTLIDPKEYFEITWASLRSMVEPSFAKRSIVNHRNYLSNVQIVTSPAITVTDTDVLTAEGRHIAYDYLVIATGHDDPLPKTKKERLAQFQQEYEKIRSASSVLIVGGGPTGVELAGEIAVDFPATKITLVHKGPRLLEFLGPKAADKAMDWFKSKKVEVILNQRVDLNGDDNTYVTSGGETIKPDCYFLCTGKPLGSSWLKGGVLENSLDSNGRLIVDEYLRVGGRKNIFAIGDITNIREAKQGYLAQEHASVAAKNLKVEMSGGKESKMKKYEAAASAMAIVSLGRRQAIAQLPFATISGCLPGMMKSKDLFVGKTRKLIGVDPRVADDRVT